MPIRPSQHTEHNILHRILSGAWPAGTPLPPERELAQSLDVTRPTLRETLKFLERQGWITIRHGKSSVVNDFWKKGGLGILGTLARYTEFIPLSLITELLEMRMQLLPPCARIAAENDPESLQAFLSPENLPGDDPGIFSEFDWTLQEKIVLASGRQVALLMYNDFKALFLAGGTLYFDNPETRKESLLYYARLRKILAQDPEAVEESVAAAMEESLRYWQNLFPNLVESSPEILESPTSLPEQESHADL